MRINTTAIAFIVVLAAVDAPAAADFDAAEFVQGNCTRCHDHRVYTRSDRKIRSLPALETQVRRCDAMIGTRLFNEDIAEVVEYLNREYYGFEK